MSAEKLFGGTHRLVLVGVACSACFSLDFTEPASVTTAPRYLDELCARGAYELSGDARRTTGLTHDTCGFELGPSDGSVALNADPADLGLYTSYTFSVLLTDEDGESLGWVNVERQADPTTPGAGAGSLPAPPSGPFIVSAELGRRVNVVDARFWGALPSSGGCSVARPGRSRRTRW